MPVDNSDYLDPEGWITADDEIEIVLTAKQLIITTTVLIRDAEKWDHMVREAERYSLPSLETTRKIAADIQSALTALQRQTPPDIQLDKEDMYG